MVHASFDTNEVEHFLHALAHSFREGLQLVPDVFLEGVTLPLSDLLDFSVGVAGEGAPPSLSEWVSILLIGTPFISG